MGSGAPSPASTPPTRSWADLQRPLPLLGWLATSDLADTTTTPTVEPSPRATTGVLAILAALIALPLLAMLLVLLLRGGGSGGGADLAKGVEEDRIQAVYMASEAVYFGNLEAGAGDWVELRDAFFLRASAARDAKDGEEAGVTNLVPIQQQAGGDGTLVINSREVTLVQNLTADSPIAREIEAAIE